MDHLRRARAALAVLCALVLVYPLVPHGLLLDVWYDAVGAGAVALGFLGVRHHRPVRRTAWHLVLAGLLGWVVGDLVSTVEINVVHTTAYPVPSDVFYIGSYALIAAGLLVLSRSRGARGDVTALLDAAIIATGCGVVVSVFLLVPIADDSTLNLGGKVVSSLFPVMDVLLVAILVRLWASPGAHTTAFRLLLAALTSTLAGDVVWNLSYVAFGVSTSTRWNDQLWLAAYVLVAAAAWSPSMLSISEQQPDRDTVADPRRRLFVLAGGLVLPAVTLLVDGLTSDGVAWPLVALGSVLMCGLVLSRMAALLHVVSVQAVQLAALARSDALTGAPNRRTWDHELSRACQSSREDDRPLTVALLDLDHFKAYNDAHGHQAGDVLLREAVAAWTDELDGEEVLARYGGEEFALLFPGASPLEATERVERLRARTPHAQTFSAGLALWDPRSDPGAAVAAADRALYEAKHAGRDRIRIADAPQDVATTPYLTVVMQPIVDLTTGDVVGVEALSRFPGRDPATVFAEARGTGRGPDLEAAAVRAALEHRPAEGTLSLNLSVEAITTDAVSEVLPDDLRGIVLEVTEHTDVDLWTEVSDAVAALRERGAVIAVDDWGRGFSNVDRMLRLRPEIVKLDMSLVHGVDDDYHRATIRSITTWADAVGARVCAEGVETDAQWRALLALGVHLGQGYLFGRPVAPDAVEAATRPRVSAASRPR